MVYQLRRQLVIVTFGSHLYGTSTPESDYDMKCVHIPGTYDILMQQIQPVVPYRKANKEPDEQGRVRKSGKLDVTMESYAVSRYMELLIGGQTVALDMLFAPDSAIQLTTPAWRFLQGCRDQLLSKRTMVFFEYCRSQANKYGIKGSRMADASAARDLLSKAMDEGRVRGSDHLGCLVSEIHELIAEHPDHIGLVEKSNNNSGSTETYLTVCGRMCGFRSSVLSAYKIVDGLYQEYGSRARKASDNQGIDWKALSHAVRVGHEGIELFTTGKITFPLTNRTHILDIKLGKLPFKEVASEIEALMDSLEIEAARSVLPDEPNMEFGRSFVEACHASQFLDIDNKPYMAVMEGLDTPIGSFGHVSTEV